MNPNRLLEVCGFAGKLLIENGAEIYRVEETMVRLCKSFKEVEEAESFVISTGIMLSITVDGITHTKVLRVRSKGVDLDLIANINALSREASLQTYSIDDLKQKLVAINEMKRYSFFSTVLFSALSALGFALFFRGSWMDALCSFFVGMLIQTASIGMSRLNLNNFFTQSISAGLAAIISIVLHGVFKMVHVDILIISSIMLLVPGLAITNAIRDIVAGDYVSGLARGLEAFLVAVAIAAGIGFVLSVVGGVV